MTRSISVPNDGESQTHNGNLAYLRGLPDPLETAFSAANQPLTQERVIAEIIQAIRSIHTSFSDCELNAETNLALDLGFESATRVELLLEVQSALDIYLDVGLAMMFTEITVAELADLILTPEKCGADWYT